MPQRLMCITAHPDDESLAFGAALLLAADRGAHTAVFCLTEGAAGSYRQPGQSDEELAAQRRGEFAEACRALGVRDSTLLRYRDGNLWHEPFLPLVEGLVAALRRFRPHVVLTFGGDGGANLHRDHTIVSLAATAAFHWAGRSGFFADQLVDPDPLRPWAAQKLYYAGTHFLATADEEALRGGTRTPSSLVYQVEGELQARKLNAFRRHQSQHGVLERVLAQFGDKINRESYLLVAAREPDLQEGDLWDGLAEE